MLICKSSTRFRWRSANGCAVRDKCFPTTADYGYCAAKNEHYYGFKLGLRVSRIGMITSAVLLPARPHDLNFTEELVNGFGKTILGDKGFLDHWRENLLANRYGTQLIVPKRKNMKEQLSPFEQIKARVCRRIRKLVETVGSHLTERFSINKIRVHDLWHLQSHLMRKILTHTVAVYLNLQLHRKPLDLDGLVLN